MRLFEQSVWRDLASPYRWSDLGTALQAENEIIPARYCFAHAVQLGPNVPPIRLCAANFFLQTDVDVWTRLPGPSPDDASVNVHRLPSRFGVRSLARMSRELDQFPPPRRLLIQYVPHAYGYKAMNLPFCLWLRSRRGTRYG